MPDSASIIKKIKCQGFHLCYMEAEGPGSKDLYLDIFKRHLAGRLESRPFSQSANGVLWLAKVGGETLVVKRNHNEDRCLERLVKLFCKGSYAQKLLVKLAAARDKGFDGAFRLYLAGYRLLADWTIETYTIYQFVEGRPLGDFQELNAADRLKVTRLVESLHAAGLSSGDVHGGNFIKTAAGDLKVIDLSGRGAGPGYRAKDRLALEEAFGVKDEKGGFFYYAERLKRALSRFFKKMRGQGST